MNDTDTIVLSNLNSDGEDDTVLTRWNLGKYSLNSSPPSNVTVSIGPSVTGTLGNYPNVWSTTGTVTSTPWFTQNTTAPKIKLDGEGADIVVNGHSLVDAINSINDRLNCLQINPKLEAEWEELKALGDQYRKLEKQILDKQATWDRLKAMPPPEID
jgi:hypothetical protein